MAANLRECIVRLTRFASIAFAGAAIAGLCACANSEFVEHPITSLIPRLRADQPSPKQTIANPQCSALAELRARDVDYAGEDDETQRAVHDKTYADCVDWELKHRQ
jgi:hypothetical protein